MQKKIDIYIKNIYGILNKLQVNEKNRSANCC